MALGNVGRINSRGDQLAQMIRRILPVCRLAKNGEVPTAIHRIFQQRRGQFSTTESRTVREVWSAVDLQPKPTANRRYHKQIIAAVEALPPGASLDLGCGVGRWMPYSEKHSEVIGVDIIFENCQRVKTFHPGYHNLVCADARYLPFRNGIFDSVYSIQVVGSFPGADRCITESSRVLKPSGAFLSTVLRSRSLYGILLGKRDAERHDVSWTRKQLQAASLKILWFKTVGIPLPAILESKLDTLDWIFGNEYLVYAYKTQQDTASGPQTYCDDKSIFSVTLDTDFERRISTILRSIHGRVNLEVGSGPGRWSQVYCDSEYVGVDLDRQIAAYARKKWNREIIVADARYLPFRDDVFDSVFSLGTVEHFPETALAVHEHLRVCSGPALISVPNLLSPFILLSMFRSARRRDNGARHQEYFGKRYTIKYFEHVLTDCHARVLRSFTTGLSIPDSYQCRLGFLSPIGNELFFMVKK